jgi:membrane fusion protein, multidrug efflux system
MKRILVVTTVTLLALVFLYILLHKDPALPNNETSTPIHESPEIIFPVSAKPVVIQDLVLWISSSGLARPLKEATITCQSAGYLDSLAAYNGKAVVKGELLARLDPATFRIALQRAQNNLLSCRMEYNIKKNQPATLFSENQEQIHNRLDSLTQQYKTAEMQFRQGRLSEDKFLRLQRNYEAMLTYRDFDREDIIANKSGLSQALVDYEQAKLNLKNCDMQAPFSGYVADCELYPGGGFINSGFQCMKVVDVSVMKIIAEVTETQVSRIRIGHFAEVRFVAFPKQIYSGRVVAINPYIDPEKRIAKVSIEVKNSDSRIKPGMFAHVRIQGDVVPNAATVPRAALVMRDNRPVVFLAKAGIAKWSYVELGAENEDYYQILKGVVAGDSVIVEGNYNLAHDARIKVAR